MESEVCIRIGLRLGIEFRDVVWDRYIFIDKVVKKVDSRVLSGKKNGVGG
jgi:hypothetical protein